MKKRFFITLALIGALSAGAVGRAPLSAKFQEKATQSSGTVSKEQKRTPRNSNIRIGSGDSKQIRKGNVLSLLSDDVEIVAGANGKKVIDKKATTSTRPNNVRKLVEEEFVNCGGSGNSIIDNNGKFLAGYLDYNPANEMLYGFNCLEGNSAVRLKGALANSNTRNNTPYVEIRYFDPREPFYIVMPCMNQSQYYDNYTGRVNWDPCVLMFEIVAEDGTILKQIRNEYLDPYAVIAIEVGENGFTDCGSKAKLRVTALRIEDSEDPTRYSTQLYVELGSIEFYGAPAYDAVGVGSPTNLNYTVGADNNSLDITMTASSNATESMVYLERDVTLKNAASSYNLITVDNNALTQFGDGGTYDAPYPFFSMQDFEYGLMGEQTRHWLYVAGQVPALGYEAFPYLQNKLDSYGGFETYDYDLSVAGSSIQFTATVKGLDYSQLKVDAYALNKSTKQYESVKSQTIAIGNATKNIAFTVANSEINTSLYDPKYVQFRIRAIVDPSLQFSAQYENNTTVYFTKWALDLLNAPAGSTFRVPYFNGGAEYVNGEGTCTITDIPMVSDNTAYYQYYYKVRDVRLSQVYGIHNILEYGDWSELMPIYVGVEPVVTGKIMFRDMTDTKWPATMGADGVVTVTNDGTNYDNTYLTVWYDVEGLQNDQNAWDNKQPGTPHFMNNGGQNRAADGPDADAATITDADLAAAPVHLKVSVELDNGDDTWKVIDTDRYPDWSWDPADHETLPDDFYRNQVYEYPEAQGYIRIPLMAENNTVTVTAEANPDYNDGKPTHIGSQTVTRTYRFAEGSTTGIEAVDTDNNAAPRYYNLQGIEVKNPSTGIYIKVVGNKSTKVSIL